MIHGALLQKLVSLPEWRLFREDFAVATGLQLEVVDRGGQRVDSGGQRRHHAVCAAVAECEGGEMFCQRFRQNLIEQSHQVTGVGQCDAGLSEACVPVVVGGEPVGYLVFGPFRSETLTEQSWRRVRHLMERAGLRVDLELLRSGLESARLVAPRVLESYRRFVEMAVRHMVERLTAHLDTREEKASPAVRRALVQIRSEGLVRDLSLAETARRCGVSEGHLSRAFHRATGLTFREYLGQMRAEQARVLLRDPRRTITEVAFASGFQSVSQFHRVFRKVHGMAPGEMRRRERMPRAPEHAKVPAT